MQRNITFSKSLTEVFEYPSFETATEEDNLNTKSGITTNKNPIGSFGKNFFCHADRVNIINPSIVIKRDWTGGDGGGLGGGTVTP